MVKFTLMPYLLLQCSATHFIGVWVGSRDGLDGRKNLAPQEFDPQTVQSVASYYTHCYCTKFTTLKRFLLMSLCAISVKIKQLTSVKH
jgi:hypothetical protein